MKHSRFLLFVLLLPFFCAAQDRAIDSLYTLVKKTKQGTMRYSLQNKIGELLYGPYSDSALSIWKNTEVEIRQKQSLYKGAELNTLLRIRGDALNNIGFVYTDRGMVGPSLEYNFKSFRLREQINDLHGIAESLNNIAFLYLQQRDTVNAFSYFTRSAAGYEAIHDTGGIAFTMVNLGIILAGRGQDSLALKNYKIAMDYFAHLPEMERGYASSVIGIGSVYTRMRNYAEANHYLRMSLAIREKINDQNGISGSYISLARMHYAQGKTDSALFYGMKGYKLAQLYKFSENIITGAKLLSEIYQSKNDDRAALAFYKISVAARDSVTYERAGQELIRQQLSYEYAKKTAADSVINAASQKLKDAEIAARDARLAKEKLQRYWLFGGILLLFTFALVLFNRFTIIRRQKNVIELQKKIVEEKRKEVLDSIQYATRIQQALLAGETLLKNNLPEHFICYRPKDMVSGDFYWASAEGSKFWLCAADCTGHGVPGAFMSLLNISFLNEAINEKKIGTPAQVFNHVRNRVITALASDGSEEGGQDGMDAILCRFDFSARSLEFACAYNPLWLIRNENGIPTLLKFGPDKMPVGRHARDEQLFTQHSISLQPGDIVYLFTDGFADQFGGDKAKKFTYRRLEELLLANSTLPMQEQQRELWKAFDNWKGMIDQIDDVLVIAVKIK